MVDSGPAITVTMTTYNHEKFIGAAIQSVLEQTYSDFELVIVNDGSTDRTEEVIQSFCDSRIKYIYQVNKGPSAAANTAIKAARGRFIASMSGDDLCHPQRLEKQLSAFEQSDCGVVFSWVDFIDELGEPYTKSHFAEDFFNHPNRSQAEILRYFFFRNNYLCSITTFLERELLLNNGCYNPCSIQLQDFELFVKLIKQTGFLILPEKLVSYRIRDSGSNLSHPVNMPRILFEQLQIAQSFLEGIDSDLFRAAFSEDLRNPNAQTSVELALEKAFLLLKNEQAVYKQVGAEQLYCLLQDESALLVAEELYGFGLDQLFGITKEIDISNARYLEQISLKLQDSQQQLHLTQEQLNLVQGQLSSVREQLDLTQKQLDSTQRESTLTQETLRSKLVNSEESLEFLQAKIQSMENTKVWRIRERLLRLKTYFTKI